MVIATGIMIAMIDIGPRPGNMPMKVPIRQPPATISTLVIENAVDRPMRSPSSTGVLRYGNVGNGRR